MKKKVEIPEDIIAGETLYEEVKGTMIREVNFNIYNVDDSVNSVVTDFVSIKRLYDDAQLDIPFNFDDLKVFRLSHEFVEAKITLVKVVTKSMVKRI